MLKPPKVKLTQLPVETYLAAIRNSEGTGMFKSAYVKKNSKKLDVLNGGELSCAVYVTSLLYLHGLAPKVRATVYRAAEDLLTGGARKIPLAKARPGDVLVWVPTKESDAPHNHIGFYLGNRQAMSNSAKLKVVTRHHYTFKGKRAVEMALRPTWGKNA